MHHSVRIGEDTTAIEIRPPEASGEARVRIGEQELPVAVGSPLPNQLQLELGPAAEPIGGARRQRAFVARSSDGVWIWTAGRARLVRPAEERRRARGGAGAGVGQSVTPPMPSVVTKVLVEVGQQVDRGEALVVVSAMKMEMTLTAPHAGTVRAIHTEEGAKANPGDVLVEVEAATDEG